MYSSEHISFSNVFTALDFPIGLAIVIIAFDCLLYAAITINEDYLLDSVSRTKIRFEGDDWKECIDWSPHDQTDIERSNIGNEGVILTNLCKTYNGKSLSVNNMNLEIYESQITGLLGQNGAGKTTLISMLIGELMPTRGKITIFGLDVTIPSDLSVLRSNFGVCLQDDILCDELTVEEHLLFFGRIKGLDEETIKKEMKNILTQTDLIGKTNAWTSNLSGGEKRKLCIGIALIGKPKIIFLDEPTSGVDPYSRRCIWSLLDSYKKNRIVILSTHFMDEADILCDRKVRLKINIFLD